MTIAQVKIRDIRPNPFRNFDEYPLIPNKVEALKASIQETGFWNNILGRINKDGAVEIAYGHHRLEAARQVLGDDYEIDVTLRDMSDIEMFRIMGMENSEEWMNAVHHTEQVIKQAREFFDGWLDLFPGWADFVQAVKSDRLDEFGGTGENTIRQVSDWLGGAAEAANKYAYIVKYGVGAETLHRFTGLKESTIKAALAALGPTEREKRMLAKLEETRKAAEQEIRKQTKILEKAEQEKADANEVIFTAETERKRHGATAMNFKAGPRFDEAKAKEAEYAKVRDDAKQKRDTAQQVIKEATKALREAQEAARESTQSEALKRAAMEAQEYYDDKVNKIWEKWVHVNVFRDLCLEPQYRRVLQKNKQADFARYIKKRLGNEITVANIADLFRSEINDFLAGVKRAQDAKKDPIVIFQEQFTGLKKKVTETTNKLTDFRLFCQKNGYKLGGFVSMEIEEELKHLVGEVGETCFHLSLDMSCMKYTPPTQDKVIAIV